MRGSRTRLIAGLGALLCTGALVAGCGSGSTHATPPTAAPTHVSAPTSTPAPSTTPSTTDAAVSAAAQELGGAGASLDDAGKAIDQSDENATKGEEGSAP